MLGMRCVGIFVSHLSLQGLHMCPWFVQRLPQTINVLVQSGLTLQAVLHL